MRTQTFLIAGLSVASAAEILARQDSSAVCESALAEGEELFESVPPAPTDEEFRRFMFEQDNMMEARGPCELPTVNGDSVKVSSYSSFVSQFTSWLSANDDDIRSIYSVCQGNDAFESIVDGIGLPSDNGERSLSRAHNSLLYRKSLGIT